jgi:hypothetical protein
MYVMYTLASNNTPLTLVLLRMWYEESTTQVTNFGCERAVSVLVFPSNTTMCERGFSKQTLIKSHLRASLTFGTFDELMWISMANKPIDVIDWDIVIFLRRNMRDQQIQLY